MGYDLIPMWAINQYKENVLQALAQRISRLEPCVLVDGGMTGHKSRYEYIGKALMTEITGRWTDTAFTDDVFYNRWLITKTFQKSSVLNQDNLLELLTDPTSKVVEAAAQAGKRQKDLSIIAGLTANALSGENAEVSTPFPPAQIIGIQYAGGGKDTGLTVDKLKLAKYMLDKAEVEDNDRYMAISAAQLKDMLTQDQIISSYYNDIKALEAGQVRTFLGFTFTRTELLPWTGATTNLRKCFAFSKQAVQMGICKDIAVESAKVPQKNFDFLVQTRLRIGAIRLFDEGVIEVDCSETATLQASALKDVQNAEAEKAVQKK